MGSAPASRTGSRGKLTVDTSPHKGSLHKRDSFGTTSPSRGGHAFSPHGTPTGESVVADRKGEASFHLLSTAHRLVFTNSNTKSQL